ncbi:hypothetical protein GCM10020001_036710 [Nonomuraea salmonea]
MVRSVQSVTDVIMSAPTTRARVAAPALMAWSAWARACVKPEQEAPTSMSAPPRTPSRAATRAATFGARSVWVQVATSTRSISDASMPLAASAWAAAPAARSVTVSSSAATWRVRMPTRLVIHSSLVSTMAARSSFVSIFVGW